MSVVDGGPGSDARAIEAAAGKSDVLVVAGGDGSVHHAVPVAMKSGLPIVHLPYGNENLFAREFGMSRSTEDLSRALENGRRMAVDLGRITRGGREVGHFLLMVSTGPDASIVHRLAASRTRATGHLAYAGPMSAEFLRPHLPRMTVWVDGAKVVDGRRGILVVANCRQYAFRIDPCSRASMTDGKLDVLFMPCEGRWGIVKWGWKCRRRQAERAGAVAGSGTEVSVEASEKPLWQVDGEAAGDLGSKVSFSVSPGALLTLGTTPTQSRPRMQSTTSRESTPIAG